MSRRIARLANKRGARPLGNDQPGVEKFADGQTSTENAVGPLEESNSSQVSPSAPLTSEPQGKSKTKREKWTKEEYREITFCYYLALNSPITGSTTKDTYQIWRERNPTTRPNMDDVKLANQRRWIERQKKLTEIELDLIKQEIQQLDINTNNDGNNTYTERNDDSDMGDANGTSYSESDDEQLTNDSQHLNNSDLSQEQIPEEEKAQYLEILHDIRKKFAECKECEIFDRASLYKVNPNKKKTRILIKHANRALSQIKGEQFLDLEDLNHLIYAAAAVVSEEAGITPKKKRNRKTHKQPLWKVRIQKQIQEMRAEVSLLAEIESGNNSQNITRKKRRLYRKYNIRSEIDFIETKEKLKMKIQAKAQRLRRYEKRSKQFRQNKMFYEDRKKLYRELGKEKIKVERVPKKEEVEKFWKTILENDSTHNSDAQWIRREGEKHVDTQQQQWNDITIDEVKKAINNTNNWKSPGIDLIPNFWLKNLHSVHDQLAQRFNDVVRNPDTAPTWLTTGRTFLLPKNEDTDQPKNYRPITCLSTTYKLLTSIITNRCYKHLDDNNILPEEQKGCKRGSYGCKDQLLINKMIMEDCVKKKKNLSMAWIDYQKAFDSVPHSWIIETLKIYKFNQTLIDFLEISMQHWNTTMHLSNEGEDIITGKIRIKRGIFQGDSLSPLLFCVALIPLTSELNSTGFGYTITKASQNVSHLFYMDDLKLFAKTEQQLDGALHVVKEFSDDIQMQFGLSKCAKVTLRGGRVVKRENITIDVNTAIKNLNQEHTYKYLGVEENAGIQHSKMKEKIRKEYYRRVKMVLKSELHAKNKIESINSIAVPVVQYSFGIIDWKVNEIIKLDRKTRKLLTMHRMFHPRSDVDRLYIQRKYGGRGLIQLEASFKTAMVGLDCYITLTQETKLKLVKHHDSYKSKYSISKTAAKVKQEYHLVNEEFKEDKTPSENAKALKMKLREKIYESRKERWEAKPLHGQYCINVNKPYVDQVATNAWLTSGDLKGETEGFIAAAQDQSLLTRNYQHYVLKDNTTDGLCRLCHSKTESIDHLLTGCEILAPTQYLKRHNNAASYLHWILCKDNGIEVTDSWYEHDPPKIVRKDHITIMWDCQIITDRTIKANRPDIVVKDINNKICQLIDVSTPSDRNICLKHHEKMSKYKDLEIEISRMWSVNTQVIPVIIGALGTTKNGTTENLQKISKNIQLKTLQKIVLLGSAHIMRNIGL